MYPASSNQGCYFLSQYHELIWADNDSDGACEFGDVGIDYFKWSGESFSKQIIDYGPAWAGKGCGIHFAVADLNGSGRLVVIALGKDCLYFYENSG